VQQLVDLYSTENEEKSSVVECWNRTVKEKMFKYFTTNSTRKYIDILDEFVNWYNNTVHSSIKMTPTEASKTENENQVWRNLYGDYSPPERKAPKFSIDDNVRITKKKSIFEKGCTPRWTEEVFLQFQKFVTRIPTKVCAGRLHTRRPVFHINNSAVEYVEQWPHLGHVISSDLDDKHDISRGRSALVSQINSVLCFLERLIVLPK